MSLYQKIKKEHLFIFLVIFTALVIFNYFSEFNYTGLVIKEKCNDKDYSCCFPGEGRGVNHFSLDDTCKDKTCWDSCEKSEVKNLITGNVNFIDSIINWFKSLFKKMTVGELIPGQTCPLGQNKLFTVSSIEGEGHASIYLSGENSYGNSVCSSIVRLNTTPMTNSDNKLIGLSEPTNAHVEMRVNNNYLINIYVEPTNGGNFDISYNTDCDVPDIPNEECLFSISDFISAHVGPCSLYNLKACVSVSTQTCLAQNGATCLNTQLCKDAVGITIPFTPASDTLYCCVAGTCQTSTQTELICNDNINNEGDTYTNPSTGIVTQLTDCKDPDCNGFVGGPNGQKCELNNEKTCNDNFDNDRDFSTDCGDYVNCVCTRFSVDNVSVTLANGIDGNILINPGFENGIGGWNGYPNNNSFNFSINTAAQYLKEGTKSLNIITNNTRAGITQHLVLQPNSLYKYSAWIYVTYGRVGMTFWGDDRASLANFTTPYNAQAAQAGWYHLENYILTNSNPGQANGYNNEITIYSWPNVAQEICDDGTNNNEGDNLADCSDSDCNEIIHYESGVEKWKCFSGVKKELDCDDLVDNDGDNLIDSIDTDCILLVPEVCTNSIDDDGDGIDDVFDNNCTETVTTPYYVSFNNMWMSNISNFTYSNQELDIRCPFTVITEGGTFVEGYANEAYDCVRASMGGVDCTNRQKQGNTVRFNNCNVGSKGTKEVKCYSNPNCNQYNFLITEMDVRDYNYCDYGEKGYDISLYENEIEINDNDFETGELVSVNLTVFNYINEGLTVVAKSTLFDINDGEELIWSSPIEKTISFNEDLDYGEQNFLVSFGVPNTINEDHQYKVYVKVYEKNNEDENCDEYSFSVDLEQGTTWNPPTNRSNQTCNNGQTQACSTGLLGVCANGVQTCSNGIYGSCIQTQQPLSVDICGNGLDDDCDGASDCSDTDCSIVPACRNLPPTPGGGLSPSEDEDGDELLDSWELQYFGSTTLVNTANGDYDGDGVSNIQEYLDGTDPNNIDDYLKGKSYWWLYLVGIIILIIIIYFVISNFFKGDKRRKESYKNIPHYTASSQGENKLRDYVRSSLLRGFNKEQIRRALKAKGWKDKEIEEAFR